MADKYAHKNRPAPLLPHERVKNILQCRMPWSTAEQCANALNGLGLPCADRAQAIAVLAGILGRPRAEACARDLAGAGLIPMENGVRR